MSGADANAVVRIPAVSVTGRPYKSPIHHSTRSRGEQNMSLRFGELAGALRPYGVICPPISGAHVADRPLFTTKRTGGVHETLGTAVALRAV